MTAVADQGEIIRELFACFADVDPDWCEAVLAAALDETHDLGEALELAKSILAENPTDPSAESDEESTDETLQLSVGPHSYASTQLDLPEGIAKKLAAFAESIPSHDLAEAGRETDWHITLKYGLQDEGEEKARAILAAVSLITVRLGCMSIFRHDGNKPAEDGEHDVLKIDVESPDLHALHELLSRSLANTETFPEYRPHLTLAYLLPGKAAQYIGDDCFDGIRLTFDAVSFCRKDGVKVSLPLGAPVVQPLQLSAGWTRYRGTRGGIGWMSNETGRVVYQTEQPGEHEHKGPDHPEPRKENKKRIFERGEQISKNYYHAVLGVLHKFQSGQIDGETAKARLLAHAAKAKRENRKNFVLRLRVFAENVMEKYGAKGLTPEWQKVKDEFRRGMDIVEQHIDGITRDVVRDVDYHDKHGEFPRGVTKSGIGAYVNDMDSSYYEFVNRMADAFEAFTAKYKPLNLSLAKDEDLLEKCGLRLSSGWTRHDGPRGGVFWQRGEEKRYQEEEPGERNHNEKPEQTSRPSKRSAAANRVKEQQPSEKAKRAKAAHVLVDKEIQRYAETYNEPRFAKVVGGVSFPDSEPVDVAIAGDKAQKASWQQESERYLSEKESGRKPSPMRIEGKARHGIELKTMTVQGENNKITMDSYSQIRKLLWEKEHGATFHTVISDDRAVINAKGAGQHDETKRRYYYRRGVAGSARISGMYECKDEAELKRLIVMPEDQLPEQARRTDHELRSGRWKAFQDEQGKGFKDLKSGRVVRAKK